MDICLHERGQAPLQLTAYSGDARSAAGSLLVGAVVRPEFRLVLIDEGGQFLGLPRGEGLLEKIQERGDARAQQPARRV